MHPRPLGSRAPIQPMQLTAAKCPVRRRGGSRLRPLDAWLRWRQSNALSRALVVVVPLRAGSVERHHSRRTAREHTHTLHSARAARGQTGTRDEAGRRARRRRRRRRGRWVQRVRRCGAGEQRAEGRSGARRERRRRTSCKPATIGREPPQQPHGTRARTHYTQHAPQGGKRGRGWSGAADKVRQRRRRGRWVRRVRRGWAEGGGAERCETRAAAAHNPLRAGSNRSRAATQPPHAAQHASTHALRSARARGIGRQGQDGRQLGPHEARGAAAYDAGVDASTPLL
eukprot:scaffold9809_cov60-Phaeocystis_antarctica.AAC.4